MRLKTSGNYGAGRFAWGDGGGESRGADSDPVAAVVADAEEGIIPGLSPPPAGAGEKGSATPPPVSCGSTPPGSPRLARSGAWLSRASGRRAPGRRRGKYPASRAKPCTGGSPEGSSSGGPGRPGGPAPARITTRPPPRVGPRGRAPGVPARNGAGLLGSLGPPRSRFRLCGPPGSSG